MPFSDARLPTTVVPRYDCREGDEVEVSRQVEYDLLVHLSADHAVSFQYFLLFMQKYLRFELLLMGSRIDTGTTCSSPAYSNHLCLLFFVIFFFF